MKLSDVQDRSDLTEFFERLGIGVAVAGGVAFAACISGMPAASCAAMAETYARAGTSFGMTGLIALLGLFTLGAATALYTRGPKWMLRIFGFATVIFAGLLFFGDCMIADSNLRTAFRHCYVGSDAEVAARAHKQIPLLESNEWRSVFSYPLEWRPKSKSVTSDQSSEPSTHK